MLGIALSLSSQTVKENATYAAAVCLATLLFSAKFVSRGRPAGADGDTTVDRRVIVRF